jgi:hypothetical protein
MPSLFAASRVDERTILALVSEIDGSIVKNFCGPIVRNEESKASG